MNDQFKNLFKGIVFILLIIVALLCLSITFHSCRSQKESTSTTSENVELFMPFVDSAIEVPEMAPFTPSTAGKAHYAVLRGKRASIGRSDLAERNASRCASQVDSAASYRSMDRADHYARDTVAITKPPTITWWPLAIIAALALVAAARYWYSNRK